MTFFLPTQVVAITGQKLGFQASLVTAIPWIFGLASVAFSPALADRTRQHRIIGCGLLLVTALFKKTNQIEAGHLDKVDARGALDN